jgi:predicted Zn-dependent protease
MSWKIKIQESFEKNSKVIFSQLKGDEVVSLSLLAEESEFVRFNKGKIRQATAVEQAQVTLIIQTKTKMTKISFGLTGEIDEDRKRSLLYLGKARQEMEVLPENPFPVVIADTGTSHTDNKAQTPSADFFIDQISKTSLPEDDLVGYLASGPLIRAIANSKGTYHWHSSDIFFVDYSLFMGIQGEAKAVTATVAGSQWDQVAWENSLNQSRTFLQQLQKPAQNIKRGKIKVYLAPAAVMELKSVVSWNGFSQAAFKQGQCGLRLLAEGQKTLSEKLSVIENFDLGVHPRFNTFGELSPHQIPLIENGKLKNFLTSMKSAAEYKVPSNGADAGESPVTMEIKPGTLKQEDILKSLGTGLYISNLHYVNWSDQKLARLTGMTRFACFWVENGEIVSPIQDMRFDVSLYDIWGPDLVELTEFQEVSVNILTYSNRDFGGSKLPGMLIKDFEFTL